MVLHLMGLSLMKGVFNSISKTKKASWKAMGSAVQAVQSTAGQFDIMGSALMFMKPIVRTIGVLFKVMGASIMKSVMPALQPLLAALSNPETIALMTELGGVIGGPLYMVLLGFKLILEQLIDPIRAGINWIKDLQNWFWDLFGITRPGEEAGTEGFTEEQQAIITDSNITLGEEIANAIPFLKEIPNKLTMMTREEYKKPPVTVNIDLRDAVVDNVDNLSRKLMERVMIELG